MDTIRFYVRRLFKPEDQKHYFVIEIPGTGDLIIPQSRIDELPNDLKQKFYRQREMTLQMLMPALNEWVREKDGKA